MMIIFQFRPNKWKSKGPSELVGTTGTVLNGIRAKPIAIYSQRAMESSADCWPD